MGSLIESSEGKVAVAMAADQKYGKVRFERLHPAHQSQPVHLSHLHVADDDVKFLLLDQVKPAKCGGRSGNLCPFHLNTEQVHQPLHRIGITLQQRHSVCKWVA